MKVKDRLWLHAPTIFAYTLIVGAVVAIVMAATCLSDAPVARP
jgi:flagellar biosynthesis protein FliQ